MKVLLLFGLPESGVEAAARAVRVGGASLAADAETVGARFAASRDIDRRAREINAAFGASDGAIGPIALANTPLAESRRRIAAALGEWRQVAADACATALPGDCSAPVVIAAGAMGSFPAFWLDALTRAGAEPTPVLVHRHPIVIARLARADRGRPMRQTIFQWHHLAIEVLALDPGAAAVLNGPDFDPSLLGVGLARPPSAGQPDRHDREDDDLSDASMLSRQSRDLNQLLDDWRTLGAGSRSASVADLKHRYDDAVVLAAAAKVVAIRGVAAGPAPEPRAGLSPEAPAAVAARSPLLFHYHIFKNAGTSVDRMLKANFGDRWAEREFSETPPARRHAGIREFLAAQPGLCAVSSHTAPLPEPDLADREVVPILFVRHPLLRVRSAYRFEHRQDATTRGAVLAKVTDLRGYVTTFLDDPKARQVRDFQSVRFAAGTPGRPAQEFERALATLDRLPFVGLVEAYDESIARLGALVRPLFPAFTGVVLHENATATDPEAPIDDQLAALREELGASLYDRLADANRGDLELFDRVRARYATAR